MDKAHGLFFERGRVDAKTNIVLIGYRCSGKTTLGRLLSERLGRPFQDVDRLMEHETGMPLCDLAGTLGWPRFRDLEQDVIGRVAILERQVIATGGGAVTRRENVLRLKANGWVVWLQAGVKVLGARLQLENERGRQRPALTAAGSLDEIEKVLEERHAAYFEAADAIVDSGTGTEQDILERILEKSPFREPATGPGQRRRSHAG